MSATLSILGLELRLLRRDLLLALVVLASVAGFRLVYGADAAPGAGVHPYALGGLLLALLLVGITRYLSVERAWAGLRGALPLPPRRVELTRAVLWSALAAALAVAYVGVAAPGRLGESPLRHIVLVWLWALAAGLLAGRLAAPAWRAAAGSTRTLTILVELALLGTTLPGVVLGRDVWLPVGAAAGLLAAAVGVGLVAWVRTSPEWLPAQSPKGVRPRRPLLGGLRRGRPQVRSPRQVLRHLGVRDLGLGTILPLWPLGYGVSLLILVPGGGASAAVWNTFVVLGCGLVVTLELRLASARWALLRAYPLARSAVWRRPLGGLVAVAVIGLLLSAWAHQRAQPGRLVGNLDLRRDPSTNRGPGWMLPALRVPGWARSDEATRDRPAAMPAPRWNVWPLRQHRGVNIPHLVWLYGKGQRQGGIANEQRYFVNALHYYLDLVHGVDVADEELLEALGDPVVVDTPTAEVPVQYYLEHVSSDGSRLFSHPLAAGDTHVTVEMPPHRPDTEHEPLRAIVMYAYAPALERLEARLGDRLARAARWRSVLELCLLVLAILLFVRCALLEGPMRWTAPALALVAIGLWYGSRATALNRAVRDLHLAHVWIAPALTLVAGTLLVCSIRRRLGRAAPAAILRSGWVR